MTRQLFGWGACAVALALASSAATQTAPADDSFSICNAQCRTTESESLRQCTGSTGPSLERCRSRVQQTVGQCLTRCSAAENRRLSVIEQRTREREDRARRRTPTEPQS